MVQIEIDAQHPRRRHLANRVALNHYNFHIETIYDHLAKASALPKHPKSLPFVPNVHALGHPEQIRHLKRATADYVYVPAKHGKNYLTRLPGAPQAHAALRLHSPFIEVPDQMLHSVDVDTSVPENAPPMQSQVPTGALLN